MSSRQLNINLELSNKESRIRKFMIQVLEMTQGLNIQRKISCFSGLEEFSEISWHFNQRKDD